MDTQNKCVLDHMRQHGQITPLDALKEYGIMRLGARIFNLKQDGFDIKTEMIEVKNRFDKTVRVASYSLTKTLIQPELL